MQRLTLRTRLALLVLVGVLPFILFNLGSAWLGYRDARTRTAHEAVEVARRVARAVQAELTARTAVLEALALSRSLGVGDLDAFRRQAEAVLARQAPGANILLLRPDGQQVLNTAAPPGEPLPRRQNLENQSRVLATGEPSVSDIYHGLVVGRLIVAIEVLARTPEGPLVLALNPAPDAFDAILAREQPTPDWALAVIDRAGTRVARVPEPERFRGQPATPEFLQVWARGTAEGVQEMETVDGIASLVAHARIPGLGWGVAAAVPLSAITGPAWQEVQATLAVGLGLLLIGLALARWLSLGIMRPVLGLLRLAAQANGGPERARPEGLGMPEADRLAEILLAQARRRAAATAALLESERRLRLVVAELNHRAKNALATVQALALQTARGEAAGDPARFTETFTGRLQSLARAHDLLTTLSWEGAALGAIVRAGLAPWLEPEDGAARPRLVLDCSCDLAVPPAGPGQVQALVMALHELATNAAKHGALSVPEGHVEVSCTADPAGMVATLSWREVGGPPLRAPPARLGFGRRLLERAVVRDLGPGAAVLLDFAAEGGLRASIRFTPRAGGGAVA